MPNREELLQSIHPGMKLDKAFFLNIYADEITYPGFSEIAIKALEDAGCSKARSYYDAIVAEYEKKYRESMLEVSIWYQKQLDQKWEKKVKECEELRKLEKIEERMRDLHQKSDRELYNILQSQNLI